MTRKQEQKAETHQRMLQAAVRSFRQHGFAGIGVDGIAKAAGVTSVRLLCPFRLEGRRLRSGNGIRSR